MGDERLRAPNALLPTMELDLPWPLLQVVNLYHEPGCPTAPWRRIQRWFEE